MLEKVDKLTLKDILSEVSKRTGTDFSSYKESTIFRRLLKRIDALKLEGLESYYSYLVEHKDEAEILAKFMLIGVTGFFRDRSAFEKLHQYISFRAANKEEGEELRIWVPGCGEGKEAYSIALLVHEVLAGQNKKITAKIFATDINELALQRARAAVFNVDELEDVPESLRTRYFFEKPNNEYELIKEVRQSVVFSRHDLTSNPPFLKQDLISCRNLLIYFNSKLQEEVFPLFHFALQPGGYLFLGRSESVSRFPDLFTPVDQRHRIFQRREGGGRYKLSLNAFSINRPSAKAFQKEASSYSRGSLQEQVKNALYRYFEHPYVIVNEGLGLLEIHGKIQPFLQLKEGNVDVNILKMASANLVSPLRKGIADAKRSGTPVKLPAIKLQDEEQQHEVVLTINPLSDNADGQVLFMIIFEGRPSYDSDTPAASGGNQYEDTIRVIELEHELVTLHEHLQVYTEELETSNEEMQSLNEEMQSINAELTYSNEGLENSNAELVVLNESLQRAVEETAAARKVIEEKEQSIRASEARHRAMLDNALQAMWLIQPDYTLTDLNKAAAELIRRISGRSSVQGESFLTFVEEKDHKDFITLFESALAGETKAGNREIQFKDRPTVFLKYQFTPVFQDGQVVQVAYSSVDVSTEHNSRIEIASRERLLQAVFDTALVGLCMMDEGGRLLRVNRTYCDMFGYAVKDLLGIHFTDLLVPEVHDLAISRHEKVIATGESTESTAQGIAKDGRLVDIKVSSSRYSDGKLTYRVAAVADITEELRVAKGLRRKERDLYEAQRQAKIGSWSYDSRTGTCEVSDEVRRQSELPIGVPVTREIGVSRVGIEDRDRLAQNIRDAIDTRSGFDIDVRLELPSGTLRYVNMVGKPIFDENGSLKRIIGTDHDVTERKLYEERIKLSEQSLVEAQALGKMGSWSQDLTTGSITWSEELFRITRWNPEKGLPKADYLKNIIQEEDWELLSERTRVLKASGESFGMDVRLKPFDGKVLHVHYNSRALMDDTGKVVKIYGVIQDVTERIEMEQKLRDSKNMVADFQKAIDITSVLCMLDGNGNFIRINDNFLKLSGYKEKDLKGRQVSMVNLKGKDNEPLNRLSDSKIWKGEMQMHSRSGEQYWLDGAIIPFMNENDEPYQYLIIANEITEQKLANDRIKASQQDLSIAQRIAKLGNWEFDRTSDTVSWSEQMNEILEWDPSKPPPRPKEFNQFFSSRLGLRFEKFLDNVCLKGEREELDVRIKTAKGKTKYIQITCEPVKDREGNFTKVKGVTMDITERKKAEKRLKQSHKELSDFKSALDISSIVDISDEGGKLVYVNDNFCAISGYAREQLIGNSHSIFKSDLHQQAFYIKMWTTLKAGKVWKGEIGNRSHSGSIFWVDTTIVPFLDSEGRPFQYLSIRKDVTERKIAEDRIKENEQLLRSVNTNISDGIFRSTADFKLLYANEALVHMFGYSTLEEAKESGTAVIAMNNIKRKLLTKKIIEQGYISNEEVLFKRKDGSTFWGLASSLLTSNDNDEIYFDGAVKDITDRKLYEDELRYKNAQLEKTNRELDRFVYSASHNLRAPLSSLLGLINITKMEKVESQYLDMMEQSVHKMDSFIKEIVDYSRNSRLELSKDVVDLEEVVRESFQQLRFMKNADKIQLRLHSRGDYTLISDLGRIRLLVENLISNAVKYHDYKKNPPYVKVSIKVSRIAARIVIEDNGVGIDGGHHDRLFEMFYRATEMQEGSGLGLFIVKEVIDRLDGKIKMRSVPSEGSTFEVIIPNLI